MARATWNGVLLAEAPADRVQIVEGNVYFPRDSIRAEHLRPNAHHTICPWKTGELLRCRRQRTQQHERRLVLSGAQGGRPTNSRPRYILAWCAGRALTRRSIAAAIKTITAYLCCTGPLGGCAVKNEFDVVTRLLGFLDRRQRVCDTAGAAVWFQVG